MIKLPLGQTSSQQSVAVQELIVRAASLYKVVKLDSTDCDSAATAIMQGRTFALKLWLKHCSEQEEGFFFLHRR